MFRIDVPVSQAGGETVCVDLDSLRQPAELLRSGSFPARFEPVQLRDLTWEVRIADQKDPAIHAANVAFGITNVRFYGLDSVSLAQELADVNAGGCYFGSLGRRASGGCTDGIRPRDKEPEVRAVYDGRLVLGYDIGAPAWVEVRRLDGSLAASLSGLPSRAQALALPLTLPRGLYLVILGGAGLRRPVPMAVLR